MTVTVLVAARDSESRVGDPPGLILVRQSPASVQLELRLGRVYEPESHGLDSDSGNMKFDSGLTSETSGASELQLESLSWMSIFVLYLVELELLNLKTTSTK